MRLSIRQATTRDVDEVAGILREAARWLEERRMAMWREDELLPDPHCRGCPLRLILRGRVRRRSGRACSLPARRRTFPGLMSRK